MDVNDTVHTVRLQFDFKMQSHSETRMHSSRMRTACLLPISPSMHCLGGYLVLGDVPAQWGVYLPRGCTWSQGGCTWSWRCTWSQGVYLVPVEGVPGPSGGVPGPGGVTGPSGEVYLVLGVYLVPVGGVPGARGCTCPGGTCPGTPPPCEQNDRQVQKHYLATNFVCGR